MATEACNYPDVSYPPVWALLVLFLEMGHKQVQQI